MNQRKLVILMV